MSVPFDPYGEKSPRRIKAEAGLTILEIADDEEAWVEFYGAVMTAHAAFKRDSEILQRLAEDPPDVEGG